MILPGPSPSSSRGRGRGRGRGRPRFNPYTAKTSADNQTPSPEKKIVPGSVPVIPGPSSLPGTPGRRSFVADRMKNSANKALLKVRI